MSLRKTIVVILVMLLTACSKPLQLPDPLTSHSATSQPEDHLTEIDVREWSRAPEEARYVSVVTAGNVRGEGLEIIAFASEEVFIIAGNKGDYTLGYGSVINRYISSAVARDLTGDGRDELILAGATTPRWEDEVYGWLGVYTFVEEELKLLSELSIDTMPLWSCATKNTGLFGEAILASNGHNLYVFSFIDDKLKRIAAVPEFPGGIATTQGEEKQGLMAWRSEDGSSYGLFSWGSTGLVELWREVSIDQWASTIPSVGDLTGNGGYVAALQGRDGSLRMFSLDGSVYPVPDKLLPVLAEPERLAPPVLIDVTGDGRAELMLGRRTKVVVYSWRIED